MVAVRLQQDAMAARIGRISHVMIDWMM
jgi:hypothetical protein